MATVTVYSFTVVRDALGASQVEVAVDHPETVRAVIDALLRTYGDPLTQALWDPSTGEMTSLLIRLNDEVISSDLDLDKPVRTGDEFTIIYPIGGGGS